MKIKNLARLFYLLIVLSACKFYPPEFKGIDNVEFIKNEAEESSIKLSLKIYNPNTYPIKLKSGFGELYLENKKVGELNFKKKIKLKAKKENKIEPQIFYKLEKNALIKLTPMLLKDSVEFKIEGNVKAGIWFFSKKNQLEYTQTINPRKFVGSFIKQ